MEQVKGYLKTKGTKLINGLGEEILLRGVGLGGWLLPEGYMWKLPEEGDRLWKIEQYIEGCIGNEEANYFWKQYRENYITEKDIVQLKKEGFNSIRLPFNARLLTEEEGGYNASGLYYIDRVIDWCEKHRLYVVLDMHGAPGGQTGTNIDDSRNDHPDLFVFRENQVQAIDLWRFLAERYKDRWIIAGYDLMNEPLPEWNNRYNHLVMPLYKEIIEAIREVDQKHIIILEGVHWSTDWSIFNEMPDDQVVLQFHKYWNNPDQESIQQYLDMREKFQVPIYMGEGGENNKAWYTGAFPMFEAFDISWNFWTYKKMDANNSPCSVKIPKDWQLLVDDLKRGAYSNKTRVATILNEFVQNVLFEHCTYHKDVMDALLRRPPIKIPAIFYEYDGPEVSYHTKEQYYDIIGFRKNDGIYIEFVKSDRESINFQHGGGENWQDDEQTMISLRDGEWVNYHVSIDELRTYALDLNIRSQVDNSEVIVTIGENMSYRMYINENSWKVITVTSKAVLARGNHHVKIAVMSGAINLQWLELRNTTTLLSVY